MKENENVKATMKIYINKKNTGKVKTKWLWGKGLIENDNLMIHNNKKRGY